MTDFTINIRNKKKKIGTIAWSRRSNAMPRCSGSPRLRNAMPRSSRNFSGGVSGPPRHRDLHLGRALRLGVHSYA